MVAETTLGAMRRRTGFALGLLAAGAGTLAYASLVERVRYTLRRADVPVLAPGEEPLRVLHVTDLHMTPNQGGKQEWVRTLDALDPDLVVLTGDNLAHPDAVPGVLHALGPLLSRPAAFVPGSNDYYGPVAKNPFVYFDPDHKRRTGVELPWPELRRVLTASGWVDCTNRRGSTVAGGRTIALSGVDDPHIALDDYDLVAGRADTRADVRLGLVHSPEPRVVDRFADDGYDLVLSGHTHGGQVCVPLYGALVTNCGLDPARAKGLHRWSPDTWLHVSAGLGTSPYAPVRFACPPEATLLTLVPAAG
jgi:predicted MPP superfamily phosphohydrolase